ncbi:glycerol-3-phosphate 1-O-acyltransferase PlsY [Pelagovum sp. HNIBRBA483]|uniref:glycerol-3-phosphate 1-O-acyltransferase PlsY n=1 Tax=Pelagovum sp. HNIBRBA483 TaxID=3233341 RepID=UPI0034A5AB55
MPEITTALPQLLVWALIGYGLGSVPFGLILSRLMNLGDLRQIGSGNIGATNVLRTGNKTAAFLTLLLDGGKGVAAVLLARAFAAEDALQLAALAAFIGHCFPVWLAFKGGKGVATFLGLLLAIAWPVGVAACATWLVTAVLFRFSSLAALVAAVASPVWALFFGYSSLVLVIALLAVLILWRHSANIIRLRAGTETKIGQKS